MKAPDRKNVWLPAEAAWMAILMAVVIVFMAIAFPLHARQSRKKLEVTGVGVYSGQIEADGRIDGKGKMTYLNGDVYDGEWRDGKRHGQGRLTAASGAVFEGEWVDDDLRHGTVTHKGMGTYEGYFRNLKANGYGVLTKGGHTIEGHWRDDLRDGIMKDTDRDGNVTWSLYSNGERSPLQVAADSPDMGIDISRYQSNVIWPNLYFYDNGVEPDYRTNGALEGSVRPVKFVIIKATEGGDHSDPMMEEHAEKAQRYNYPRGFYHFYNTTSSASANAANFISRVRLEDNDLPPILDIEIDGENVDSLVHWMQLIENHYGRKPMIYTNERYYKKYVEGTPLEEYPLWYSRYGRKDIDRGAPIFQFTEDGLMDGVVGHAVDVNIIRRGTIDDIIRDSHVAATPGRSGS